MQAFILNHKKKLVLWVSIFAAAILLCALALFAYFTPAMYVSLDVNPSIEYSVNNLDRVLSVTAVNDDGEEILEGLDLTNKSINEAVEETVQIISDNGYFDGDTPGAVEITTSTTSGISTDKADQLAEELQNHVQQVTEEKGKTVEVASESVPPERVQEAKELGISPGKLNLIQKLQASAENPDSITVDDWKNKPVKDIMKTIKENKKAAKEQNQEQNKETNQENTSSNNNSTTALSNETTETGTCNASGNPKSTEKAKENSASNNAAHANSNATKNKATATSTTTASETSTSSCITESSSEQSQKTNGNSLNTKSNNSGNNKNSNNAHSSNGKS